MWILRINVALDHGYYINEYPVVCGHDLGGKERICDLSEESSVENIDDVRYVKIQ